ncbi:hypothetical protein RRG08_046017 [Elysia crispata]|uniref:Uncharacterized protein n=1 Tax=Elysia crispata TaxID=231223 RepID=A0AAE0ZDH0_9GAST|nr:hypothetical protein RRG08_046017 [Elysia crispata]
MRPWDQWSMTRQSDWGIQLDESQSTGTDSPTTPRYYSGSTKPPRVDKQQQQGEQSRWLTYLGHPQLLVTDSFSRRESGPDGHAVDTLSLYKLDPARTDTRHGATDGKRTQLAWFTSIQKKFCPLSRTQSPRGIKPRTQSNTESSRNQAKNTVEHRVLEESSQEHSRTQSSRGIKPRLNTESSRNQAKNRVEHRVLEESNQQQS